MSVNARTFQVVSAVRALASNDLPTSADDIGTLFRDIKNADKAQFERAYLSPSTLHGILVRLVTEDGLLARENGQYQLTPKGSLLADKLALLDVDPSSTEFLDGYKAYVSLAHLLALWEAGDPNPSTTANEVANSTGLSRDSARRGLEELMLDSTVLKNGNQYTLAIQATTATTSGDPLDDVLNAVDETPISPFETEEDAESVESVEEKDGCNCENCPKRDTCPEVSDEVTTEDHGDLVVLPDWAEVPLSIQSRFVARAEVVGMTLEQYLVHFDQYLIDQARQVLLPPGTRRSRALRGIILGPFHISPQETKDGDTPTKDPNEVNEDPFDGQDGEEQSSEG